jgi:outer membrane receptor protein involved in Fe transport
MLLDEPGRRFCAVLLTLLSTAFQADPSAAQNRGRIEGAVVLAATEQPLPGVQVFVENTPIGTITDSEGRFELVQVPEGVYVISARFVGYRSPSQTVTVTSGRTTTIEFELHEEAVRLQDVVVTAIGERQNRSDIPATISTLDLREIDDAKPSHPSDIMSRIPGVWVNNTSGEGHMTAIRQPLTTEPVYLFLENGVPTRSTGFYNHNALYEINLPMAGGIEVIKGPGTALYGSDAIGAVINVSTRPPSDVPTAQLSIEAGAFGYARLMLGSGATYGRHGLQLDLNGTRSSGWRDASRFDRQSGTLTWEVSLPGVSRLKTTASFSHVDQEPAGASALDQEDYLRNPIENYTPISFRRVNAFRASSAYERFTSRSGLNLTPYARFNEMAILPNWSLTYDPTVWRTRNYSVGLLTRYRHDLPLLEARLIGGVDLELSPGEHVEQRIDPERDGKTFTTFTEKATIYDYDVAFRQAAPYLHLEMSPVTGLRISGGLRFDILGYRYENNLSVVNTGPNRRAAGTTKAYVHPSPKLGATYLLGSVGSAFASYAHAFRVPSEHQLFRQGATNNTLDLKPVKADQLEAGVRAHAGATIDLDISVYHMFKHDDIVSFTDAMGAQTVTNAGKTSHRGVEVGLSFEPVPALRLQAGYSYAVQRFERWQPAAGLDFNGNEMDVAPRTISNIIVTYRPPVSGEGTISVEWNRLGGYWMDPANTVRYDGHNLINMRVHFDLPKGFTVYGRLMNLTNERFADRATYTTFRGREFAPGLPRALYVGLQCRVQADH